MLNDFNQFFSGQLDNLMLLITFINVVLHLIFAGAVAKDAGTIYKLGQRPALVTGATWAFATLIGGIFVAAVYWFIHHSTLTRPVNRERNYESAN